MLVAFPPWTDLLRVSRKNFQQNITARLLSIAPTPSAYPIEEATSPPHLPFRSVFHRSVQHFLLRPTSHCSFYNIAVPPRISPITPSSRNFLSKSVAEPNQIKMSLLPFNQFIVLGNAPVSPDTDPGLYQRSVMMTMSTNCYKASLTVVFDLSSRFTHGVFKEIQAHEHQLSEEISVDEAKKQAAPMIARVWRILQSWRALLDTTKPRSSDDGRKNPYQKDAKNYSWLGGHRPQSLPSTDQTWPT